MTDDQFWRIAITSASTGIFSLIFASLKAKLRAKRDQTGRVFAYRAGRWLGDLWARAYRRIKN